MTHSVSLSLPWPPSVNHYWVHSRNGTFISKKGVAFREEAAVALRQAKVHEPMEGYLRMAVYLFPPDRRKRDIDNVLKALLDALQYGGLMEDDNQVSRIEVEMMEMDKEMGGSVEVHVTRHDRRWVGVEP